MTVLKTSLRSFLSHKGRMVLSGIAVVLSVAFVCGTLVLTDTMNATFDKLFASSASNVMVSPYEEKEKSTFDEGAGQGMPDSVPASLVQQIEGVDGVERVTGVIGSQFATAVDSENENIGPSTGAPTIVANWSLIDERISEIIEGKAPSGPDQVMVDNDTADKHDLAVGDPLRLLTASGDHPVTISGISDFTITNPGAAIIYTDLPTAQLFALGGEDAFTEIYVDSSGAVTDEQLKERVAAAIGGESYKLQTQDEYIQENRDELGEVLSILEYVLLGFAGVAVLVGIFLIVNTFSMLVAQRTREIGLMRAIGSSRRQTSRTVLIEAALLGVIGSVLGVGAGIGLAVGLMAVMGAIGVELSTDDLTIDAYVPVVGILLGVIVTLIAAYIPARRAGKISPMAALRDAGMPGDVRAGRVRAGIGAGLTLVGLAMLATTAFADEAASGSGPLALGVLLSLVGMILVGPALVGLVVRGLSAVLLRGFGPVGRLAERNALRNPRRTGATASALMIGLALVAGLSVVGSSMVASATEEIDDSFGADFVINTNNFQVLQPYITDTVEQVPELSSVTAMRTLDTEITTPGGETFDREVNAVDPTYTEAFASELKSGSMVNALEPGGISIDADTAEKRNLSMGDELTVAFDGGETATLTVRAISTGESTLELDTWYVATETAGQNLPELPHPLMVFATAEEGQSEAARASLDKVLEPYPHVEVRDQAEFKDLIQDQIGMLLNMVYGLLALAIIVAILGVVNTLALSVVERTREIGLMRAIGLSRRQLRRMIRLESVVIALFGALLGLGLGMAWGAAGQQLLALEGMPVLEIPWATIIWVFIGSAFVGLLAALMPAFRAGRMNVLNAIATE